MHFLSTIAIAAATVSVYALPVAVLPEFIHPSVYAFKDDNTAGGVDVDPFLNARYAAAVDTTDVEPDIDARDETALDVLDAEPNIKARSEPPVMDPEDQAEDGPRIQARSEDAVEAADPSIYNLKARGYQDNNDYDRHPSYYTSSRASRGNTIHSRMTRNTETTLQS
ncbi:hypothetical protein ColLi_13171 [Colletotrichum liriopes]|uniref:Uncharacterized protein n=1 Tax=Colletotrichum liriopes TaxID=708192 RepID=A0AA37GZQ4_9PEZI|nr:hypothetical protein ColLi_13171 [Colletotrichum liriopes]